MKLARISEISKLAVYLIIPLLTGCATLSGPGDATLLSFIADGKTSKQTAILKLGQPSGTFEQERIVTYRIAGRKGKQQKKGYFLLDLYTDTGTGGFVESWSDAKFNLVLIFDENNVLQQHSLVQFGSGDKTLLDFIDDGKTARQTVMLKLGQPSGRTLEGEKIVFYRIGGNKEDGYFLLDLFAGQPRDREGSVKTWIDITFSLVLIFDENNVLQQHSLVAVR